MPEVTKNGICLLTKNGRFKLDLEEGFERELLKLQGFCNF
jgi:hypothetical protein